MDENKELPLTASQPHHPAGSVSHSMAPSCQDVPEGFNLAVTVLIAVTVAIVVILFLHESGR